MGKKKNSKITIEELTFITLIKYPFYSSIKFNCLTEIENIFEEILESSGKEIWSKLYLNIGVF